MNPIDICKLESLSTCTELISQRVQSTTSRWFFCDSSVISPEYFVTHDVNVSQGKNPFGYKNEPDFDGNASPYKPLLYSGDTPGAKVINMILTTALSLRRRLTLVQQLHSFVGTTTTVQISH